MKISRTLPSAVERFVELVIADLRLESAWLSCLSYMEELAATQIFKSINPQSPPEFLSEMEAHAADEFRHAREFAQLRPLPAFTDSSYIKLEKQMKQICGSFFIGYVGNPILITASSRHVAYVYTAYLKYTKLPQVLERLPAILADESGHLALGKKMREEVLDEQKLSLGDLNEIEKDMCLKLVERLYRVVSRFTGQEPVSSEMSLAKMVNASDAARVAWTFSLGAAAGQAQDEQSRKRIQHAVLFSRKKLAAGEAYCAMEAAMATALIEYQASAPFSQNMLAHYQDFVREADDMHIAHALDRVI